METSEYVEEIDRTLADWRSDVERRLARLGMELDQFDSYQDADLYMQSIEE